MEMRASKGQMKMRRREVRGRGEMQAGRKRSDDGGREGKSGVFG
jgi:hypothetical protein